MKIIDSHVHTGQFNISNANIFGWLEVSLKDLNDYMNKYNLFGAWLLSHPDMPKYHLNNSQKTLEMCRENNNLKPFCYPETSNDIPNFADKGCVGIGEVKVDKPIDDKKLIDIYETAAKYDLPVLIHTTDKLCYAKINSYNRIFKVCSNTKFIFHGWGWWNLFSNHNIENFLNNYDNVFMDVSANSGYLTLKNNYDYSKKFLKNHHKRVLYGSDFPMLTTYDGSQFGSNQHVFDLLNQFELSQIALDNILYKNAEKLVK